MFIQCAWSKHHTDAGASVGTDLVIGTVTGAGKGTGVINVNYITAA